MASDFGKRGRSFCGKAGFVVNTLSDGAGKIFCHRRVPSPVCNKIIERVTSE